MEVLKGQESYSLENNDENDIMSDIRYICKSCSLITESLQKGCDVMQMPNGDIIVTEIKTSTFRYKWDEKRGKLVRVQAGGRSKKNRSERKKSIKKDQYVDENHNIEQLA